MKNLSEEKFVEIYADHLNLKDKKYKYILKGNREKYFVAVSEYREKDLDYLYYNYCGIIYELNLNKHVTVKDVSNVSLRFLIVNTLVNQKDIYEGLKFVKLKGKTNNHCHVSLKTYGRIIQKESTATILPVEYSKSESYVLTDIENTFGTIQVNSPDIKSTPENSDYTVLEQLKATFSDLINLYEIKEKEYSTGEWDSNFQDAARILNTTKEKALFGMMAKHIVSLQNIVDGKESNPNQVQEKVNDIHIYLELLKKMLNERDKL